MCLINKEDKIKLIEKEIEKKKEETRKEYHIKKNKHTIEIADYWVEIANKIMEAWKNYDNNI
jgi:hypothetical protein